MKNSFARMTTGSNNFSRRWGTTSSSVDPYITGYHFVHWAYLPQALGDHVAHAGAPTGASISTGEIKNILASSCLSVNIPTATVNKAEFQGLGNIKWAAPANVEWDNNCSMKFLETSGLPIFSIMHGWVRMIRDYRAGVSPLAANGGVYAYSKPNYSATCYYWTTQPNGLHVEYHSCMTGMFPTKDPTDLFSHDITAYDKLEIDIDFNLDYLWHERWTFDKCQALSNNYHGVAWGGLAEGSVINAGYAGEDG
jgi:hypothetical protein